MKQEEQQAAEVDTLLTPLFRRNTAGLVDKLYQGEETEILISYKFIQIATENQKLSFYGNDFNHYYKLKPKINTYVLGCNLVVQ